MGVHNFVLGDVIFIRYGLVMACTATSPNLKEKVAAFWTAEPCGTRYLEEEHGFEAHAKARYELEPYIVEFAKFGSSAGLKVLEVGVGMGADYENWLRAGADATGVDLSSGSLAYAERRCREAGLKPTLRLADAEKLPFQNGTFDVVYSYGVMHHGADTAKCLEEAWRVLKPGGEARIMLYHHASITGLMLWLRYGVWRGQSLRRCVYERLESPGTKTFTKAEVRSMMRRFEGVQIEQVFSPGDLLLHKPSQRFQGAIYRAVWRMFPRKLVRKFGWRWGLFLLITATKAKSEITLSAA